MAFQDGWINIDDDPATEADRHQHVPPLWEADESVDEIYLGHMLEHLRPDDAASLLRECYRVLVPGGTLGVVVPNTRLILAHYIMQDGVRAEYPEQVFWDMDNLEHVNTMFLYSTVQQSPHLWSYDAHSLRSALERARFRVVASIDPANDPRLVSAWWNLGYDAIKPAYEGRATP
jgi:predicted SAM-dependent methyltransferase